MGDYRIEVNATGGHGCKREIKDGEANYGCGRMDCPDCIAREFVQTLKRKGSMIRGATLTHWPGQVGEVVDDIAELGGKRRGNF